VTAVFPSVSKLKPGSDDKKPGSEATYRLRLNYEDLDFTEAIELELNAHVQFESESVKPKFKLDIPNPFVRAVDGVGALQVLVQRTNDVDVYLDVKNASIDFEKSRVFSSNNAEGSLLTLSDKPGAAFMLPKSKGETSFRIELALHNITSSRIEVTSHDFHKDPSKKQKTIAPPIPVFVDHRVIPTTKKIKQ
jgi:hypothetical protein